MKNIKGITLVELIITISIMSIIVVPFVATSISSSENNAFADDKIKAYNLMNLVIEEIKSKPEFLEANISENFQEYISDNTELMYKINAIENAIVNYKISKSSFGVIPNRDEGEEQVFSSFVDDNYNMENLDIDMIIENNKLNLEGSLYNLLPQYYYLNLDGQTGNYNYSFENSSLLELANNNFSNNIESINLGIKFKDLLEGVFELHLTVSDTVDKNVKLYVMGNQTSERLKIINNGEKNFSIYTNLINNSINKYNNNLYRIEVIVEIDGEEMDRMVSYVKK
ncbi:MAG: prepilin-type N-terminal cleavage/methylation domain-containing protein [Clostridiales bacterium]